MIFTSDMKDLINLFNNVGVDFILVGGFAVNYYGYTRSTQDIDILVRPSSDNAKRIVSALSDFGFGENGVPIEFFLHEGNAVHLGTEPNRIDLLTSLKGLSYEEILTDAQTVQSQGIEFRIISLQNLLQIKRLSTRKKDQADAEELELINNS